MLKRSMIMDISNANEMLREKEEQDKRDEEDKNRRSLGPLLTPTGKFVPPVQIDKTNILLLGPTGSGTTHPYNSFTPL